VIREHGGYDAASAELDASSTTVYEMHVGLSPAAAALTGLAPGPTSRMALADTIVKDNRIPPRGFSNSAYLAKGSPAVGASYADGQYWDDRSFGVPDGATSAVVSLYYQNTPKEYIEHLRDANTTDNWGTTLYALWASTGRGQPIEMASQQIDLNPELRADFNHDGRSDVTDLLAFIEAWFVGGPSADFDGSGSLSVQDVFAYLNAWLTDF
jgi:hypothetical protein